MTSDIALPFDLVPVAEWMQAEGLGQGEITDVRQLAGGTQNILVKFDYAGQSMVLRRPPAVPRPGNNETMMREARVLSALSGHDVPHPGVIASCADESVIGACFYLMEPISGFNPVNGLPELHASDANMRKAMGYAYVDGAAALGKVDYIEAGLSDFGRPENYLQRQVGRWRKQLEGYRSLENWPGPQSLPYVERIADYLQANCPASFVPGIIHGDYVIGNVMFCNDSPALAAIVDWELATIGDPLIDLAWIIATWRGSGGPDLPVLIVEPWDGFPRAEELIERYSRNSDRDLSNINWYIVLACYKLAIILEGTFARACAGKAPMETGRLLHDTTVKLFERAVFWINR